ncbi:MAG: aminoacyl-tRNA hydrolase [Candidatus Magasanikbacteria bacterium]|nr:aminoacyl-tRNA hydrolase [Candidatus Magasanikbacteria bacterium]
MSSPKNHNLIPARELSISFSRSSGAGGQNVNKVATKATVRWYLGGSAVFSEEVKQRLRQKLAGRLTQNDELVISSQNERSQAQNRAQAIRRLNDLVRRALFVPKTRRPTRPTRASQERRLAAKKRRSLLKQRRRPGE